jgi:hypothetical protein
VSATRLAAIKAAVAARDIRAIRGEYQDWVTEEQDKRDEAIRQRDEAMALLVRLVSWCRRPEWASQAILAHVHGVEVADEAAAEGRALWSDIDALLGRDRAPAHPEGDAT